MQFTSVLEYIATSHFAPSKPVNILQDLAVKYRMLEKILISKYCTTTALATYGTKVHFITERMVRTSCISDGHEAI